MSRGMRWVSGVVLCAVAGWSGRSQPPGAGQESRPYTIRTTSRLVLLDVSVKDPINRLGIRMPSG